MAFKGMYFDKQIADSISWRLATRRFFGNQDGRLQGCNVTRNGNSVSVSTGYFIICGGTIQITATETLSAGTSGTKKLCYQIDLTQSNTDSEFNQGSFVWITGTPTQQDLFDGGTLYQLPIATVITNGTSITSMTVDLKDITGDVMSYIDLINLKLSGYDTAFNVSGTNVNFNGDVSYKNNIINAVDSEKVGFLVKKKINHSVSISGSNVRIQFPTVDVVADPALRGKKYIVAFSYQTHESSHYYCSSGLVLICTTGIFLSGAVQKKLVAYNIGGTKGGPNFAEHTPLAQWAANSSATTAINTKSDILLYINAETSAREFNIFVYELEA